jgi:hypothetical protein
MEKGTFGQCDVYVGQELVGSPGILTKLVGVGADALVEKVRVKLAAT